MAAAARIAPGRAGATTERPRRAAYGYGQFPLVYFDHLPLCLSPTAYVVVGQVLRWTRWSPAAISRDQAPEWFAIRQGSLADKLGVTERCLQKALDEAVAAGCLVARKVERRGLGRNAPRFEYACLIQGFALAKPRELSRSGNPSPGPKPATAAPETLPAAITCPEGLDCRVDQLVQLDDGTLTNKPLLKTKKKQAVNTNSCSGSVATGKPVNTNSCSPIRPRIRAIAEQFTPRLGVGPGDDVLVEIQQALGEASDKQFAQAVAAKAGKVRSYKLLVHIARECALTAPAWNRQHAPAAQPDEEVYTCCECGQPRTWKGGCACAYPRGLPAGATAP